jgi:hypothetical protein
VRFISLALTLTTTESHADFASRVDKLIAKLRAERVLRLHVAERRADVAERRVGEMEREVALLMAEIHNVAEAVQKVKRVTEAAIAAAEAAQKEKCVAEAATTATKRRDVYDENALRRASGALGGY